jgi:hypoxia up-regulated 1
LTIDIEYKTVAPLSKESKLLMAKRLTQMNQEDKNRFLREESLNKLEAFIYKCKELTWDDSVETYATPTELESLKKEAAIQSEWLEDTSETATEAEFKEHKLKLSILADPIFKRISEHQQRPTYVTKFNKDISDIQKVSQSVKDNINNTDISETEIKELDEFIDKKIQWLAGKEELQTKVELFQDAVLTISDIKVEIREMRKFSKNYDLKKRRKIVVPVKKDKNGKSNGEKSDEYGGMSKEEFENFMKATKMSKEELLEMMKNYKKPEGEGEDVKVEDETEGDGKAEGQAGALEKEFEDLEKEVVDESTKGHEEL